MYEQLLFESVQPPPLRVTIFSDVLVPKFVHLSAPCENSIKRKAYFIVTVKVTRYYSTIRQTQIYLRTFDFLLKHRFLSLSLVIS